MSTVLDDKLIDLSNHDHSTFDPACMHRNGVRRVIIAGERTSSRSQVVGCQRVGIDVIGLYAYLYWGSDRWGATPLQRTMACVRLAQDRNIPYVWLDCEHHGGTVASRHAELRQCVSAVEGAGLKAGIYTGSWWWRPNMANSTEFAHLPLWHAGYGPGGNLRSPITTVSYGGWSRVAIHQYGTNKPLCGRSVRDWNYLFAGQLAQKPPLEDEMEPTPNQIREIVRDEVRQMIENEEIRDVRLRVSQRAQDQLMHLASHEDPEKQLAAVEALKQEGLI